MLYLYFLVGLFIGNAIANLLYLKKNIGILFVDESDPSYMYLEFSKGTEVKDVCKRRFIRLNVRKIDLNSHK